MIKGNKVVLWEKRLEDAKDDYAWRTDVELCRLDATSPLNITFQEYLLNYANDLRYPNLTQRRFAIDTEDGKHIGNCMYYSIDVERKRAELGIMIGERAYWDKGYGADAINTLVNLIFQETPVERIYLHTLESNIRAQMCFQKCGFVFCGKTIRNGHYFKLMEVRKNTKD